MVKKLVDKIIEDAGKKAGDKVREAEKKLEELFLDKEKDILRQFEEKLEAAQKSIDREKERELSNFRMEKEKELLELQNRMLEQVYGNLREKFVLFLRENLPDIVRGIAGEIGQEDYVVRIPESSADIRLDNARVEKDPALKDSIIFEGKNWKLLFDWERFSLAVAGVIRERAGFYLFGEDGQERKA